MKECRVWDWLLVVKYLTFRICLHIVSSIIPFVSCYNTWVIWYNCSLFSNFPEMVFQPSLKSEESCPQQATRSRESKRHYVSGCQLTNRYHDNEQQKDLPISTNLWIMYTKSITSAFIQKFRFFFVTWEYQYPTRSNCWWCYKCSVPQNMFHSFCASDSATW